VSESVAASANWTLTSLKAVRSLQRRMVYQFAVKLRRPCLQPSSESVTNVIPHLSRKTAATR